MEPFMFSRTPALTFGCGAATSIPECVASLTGGHHVLVVTGSSSLERSGHRYSLLSGLKQSGASVYDVVVRSEPSPGLVDGIVDEHKTRGIDAVVAVGGGSVIDTGKAVSAMLPSGDRIIDYLEGVGTGRKHDGRKIPFIAVPTTAGTGSEATKNAVMSDVGEHGFKKSIRHDAFVPDAAVIDPELALSCPPEVTAASGMDAVCQLIESLVSSKANDMTDSLAWCGLERAAGSLVSACGTGSDDTTVRGDMAYGAYISGVTLANAGLGVVHGFASSIGGFFPVPHGVVCGTLLAEASRINIERLKELGSAGFATVRKYARAGGILSGRRHLPVDEACSILVRTLEEWVDALNIPRLGSFGVTAGDADRIIAATGMKNNPVALNTDDLRRILTARI